MRECQQLSENTAEPVDYSDVSLRFDKKLEGVHPASGSSVMKRCSVSVELSELLGMKETLRRASLHICGIYIRIEFHKQTAHVHSVIPSRNMQRTHRTAEHKMITTPRTTMEICTMKHTKIQMIKQMMVRREKCIGGQMHTF